MVLLIILRAEEKRGRLKVTAIIGDSQWQTTVWFDRKRDTYLLPLKAVVRKKNVLNLINLYKLLFAFNIYIREMTKNYISMLFDIALSAFQPDFKKYGKYPPLLKHKTKGFLPPLMFGKTILNDETVIGGAYAVELAKG